MITVQLIAMAMTAGVVFSTAFVWMMPDMMRPVYRLVKGEQHKDYVVMMEYLLSGIVMTSVCAILALNSDVHGLLKAILMIVPPMFYLALFFNMQKQVIIQNSIAAEEVAYKYYKSLLWLRYRALSTVAALVSVYGFLWAEEYPVLQVGLMAGPLMAMALVWMLAWPALSDKTSDSFVVHESRLEDTISSYRMNWSQVWAELCACESHHLHRYRIGVAGTADHARTPCSV